MRRTYISRVSVPAALGLASLTTEAAACGGLFCNSAVAVNQTAERSVFSVNEDETVSAVLEILYQGPSASFAWVLPVPGGKQGTVYQTRATSSAPLF